MPIKWAFIVFVFAVMQCSTCSPKNVHWEKPERLVIEPNTNGVLRLIGRWASAHGCPVDGIILTAAHVNNLFYGTTNMNTILVGYQWEDGDGNKGMLSGASASLFRDLGLMNLESGEPRYYRHAPKEPSPGDALFWLEYNDDTPENLYTRRVGRGSLLRNVSGHLLLDKGPTKGASGSCVLNSKDEVVGVVARIRTTKNKKAVGVAVSVAGFWWKQ